MWFLKGTNKRAKPKLIDLPASLEQLLESIDLPFAAHQMPETHSIFFLNANQQLISIRT